MTPFTALSEDAKDAVLSGQTIDGTIRVALGAASVCWDDDGVFMEKRANKVADDLKLAFAEYLRIAINQQSLDAQIGMADWELVELIMQAPVMSPESADLDRTDGGE